MLEHSVLGTSCVQAREPIRVAGIVRSRLGTEQIAVFRAHLVTSEICSEEYTSSCALRSVVGITPQRKKMFLIEH
jgi:hypothetical protein